MDFHDHDAPLGEGYVPSLEINNRLGWRNNLEFHVLR